MKIHQNHVVSVLISRFWQNDQLERQHAGIRQGPTEHLQDLAAEVQSGLSRLESDKAPVAWVLVSEPGFF